jgi:cyclophilin family peptidyl-prolyl cis-trans isomerase
MTKKSLQDSVLYVLGIIAVIAAIIFGLAVFDQKGLLLFSPGSVSDMTYEKAPEMKLTPGADYKAVIKTSEGDIEVDLFENNAPKTVNNFVFLARENFYDGVKFHRIVPEFVIQGGSRLSLDDNPNNDSIGGPGYKFNDEVNWDSLGLSTERKDELKAGGFVQDSSVQSKPMVKYSLAMANAGPNTNGSQFFITLTDRDSESIKGIEGQHTVFGIVTKGQEIVDKIGSSQSTDDQLTKPAPSSLPTINDIEIIEQK